MTATPATDRLEALHRAAEEARERVASLREQIRFRDGVASPLAMLSPWAPTSPELEQAERELEAAGAAILAEAREGADARWTEHMARVRAEDTVGRRGEWG